jgi:hypothetical protein
VGPFLIEARQKVIKGRLLLEQVRGRRLGRFAFERQMHALVPAILLRMPGR